ncbi:hypothetical protein OG21DRAFT_297936 [Imleria badia]|nr:hypothetical protein OG21DRAFT_297936 [Imleria badia]
MSYGRCPCPRNGSGLCTNPGVVFGEISPVTTDSKCSTSYSWVDNGTPLVAVFSEDFLCELEVFTEKEYQRVVSSSCCPMAGIPDNRKTSFWFSSARFLSFFAAVFFILSGEDQLATLLTDL